MNISNFKIEILQDPTIFEQNRLSPISDHAFYKDELEAISEKSSYVKSLNGKWRFHYATCLNRRPVGFENEGFDENGFDYINVPGHFETQGFGKPHYTNIIYPWECRENIVPGQIPTDFNPVGSYVTYFDMDDLSLDSFLAFNGVDSAFAVWLNGHYVGYSEDSCTPSHFAIKDFVQKGSNRLCVQVFKFSSGSHIEDQDFWRLSGIFRDVYVYCKPKAHLNDYFIKTELKDNYTNASVSIEPKFEGQNAQYTVSVFDANGNQIYSADKETSNDLIEFNVENASLWSAEKPNLYTLKFEIKQDGKVVEFIQEKFGIREFKLENKLMKINGKRIIFNGVNRHEFSAKNGRAITKEEILADLLLLKKYNINAIRTSHYPNVSYFYRLCDELGFYVIDETNLEAHGYWQKKGVECHTENTLPDGHAQWHDAVIARGQAMLCRDKNHPSIIIWSCGNEAFGGKNLFDLSNYFRKEDPSRLVHYEGIFHDRRYNGTSDMESQMYTTVADVRKFLDENDEKPFIMCEYTHSMGNSNGGMKLYTDFAKEGGLFQGGFIWDFADQAFESTTPDGRKFLAYGGDFGDRPTDYNFAGNGIVFADRKVTPKIEAVKFNYQGFVLEVSKEKFTVENFNLFTDLNEYETYVKVLFEGKEIYAKSLGCLDLAPGKKDEFKLDLPCEYLSQAGEYCVEVSVRLLDNTKYASKGYEIAYNQGVFNVKTKSSIENTKQYAPLRLMASPVNYAIVGDGFRLIFSNAFGTLVSIVSNDKEILKAPATYNFWRAPIDNDIGNKMPNRLGIWKIAGMYPVCVEDAVEQTDECIKITYTHELCTTPVAKIHTTYRVYPNGTIDVQMNYAKVEGLPDVPDFGMIFKLYNEFNAVNYYGLGPCENYCDREEGAKLGVFNSTVENEYVPYLKPQECGNHGQVRYFNVTNSHKLGLGIEKVDSFINVSALAYTPNELESALHTYELPNTQTSVIKISKRPMGVGGDDSWGAPILDEFINKNTDIEFKFKLRII